MSPRAALVAAALVFLLSWRVAGCGGNDLLIGSATGNPTATVGANTPTPGGCATQGQGCDNITILCCSPLTCVTGGVCE